MGSSHTVYLKGDGTVLAVGRNNYGQLVDGTTTDRSTPVPVYYGVKQLVDQSPAPNHSPSDLNPIATLTIAENQPIGSVVGEFNATDFDGENLLSS